MKKFMINLFLINIFFLTYQLKCNIINTKCGSWNEWSECEGEFMSRTYNYDYSIRDLRSCKNCGKWGNWSSCNDGKTYRYLDNCSFFKEEKDCTSNKEDNKKIENGNLQSTVVDLNYDNNRNEETLLKDNNKQHEKENEVINFNKETNLQKSEKNQNDNISETPENKIKEDQKINNDEEDLKNIHKLNNGFESSSNLVNNQNDTQEQKNEDLVNKDAKSPIIQKNKENEIKEHNQIFNINSILGKENNGQLNNTNLRHNNNEMRKSSYQKKKVRKFGDNQKIKINNHNEKIDENKSKEDSNIANVLKTYEDTNNEENKNSYNSYGLYEDKYDTKDNDSKAKYNDSIKFNRIYIASGVGAVLILTGGVISYIMFKENKTDDVLIENKDENYEVLFNDDVLKNKSTKALYEEEFWAHE
ncbi:merozoite TRAP-like protein, putative [Plasmodium relictum]|uniref:Merozoite TRAP-like protein, putative n=1 Tax=Plasmodium relictum TaxID=85471 RepID=A0A1J1H2R9_PLARL|nr:merozoite TRAP-like protein, putative [Plasmodium relictum]CRG99148.1 merozoite TRAP-like protein, putative [Plasmodium relictum]